MSEWHEPKLLNGWRNATKGEMMRTATSENVQAAYERYVKAQNAITELTLRTRAELAKHQSAEVTDEQAALKILDDHPEVVDEVRESSIEYNALKEDLNVRWVEAHEWLVRERNSSLS